MSRECYIQTCRRYFTCFKCLASAAFRLVVVISLVKSSEAVNFFHFISVSYYIVDESKAPGLKDILNQYREVNVVSYVAIFAE